LKRYVSIILVNLILILILLIPIELIFGGWLKAPGMWDFAAYRNVHWRIGVERYYKRSDRINYKRDYYGFRGNYKNIEDIDILTIGGSTTDERFVNDGETWPDTLAKCLRNIGYDADVANAGISGQSSVGHILNFHNWLNYIDGLSPKYIIAFVGINERGVGTAWQSKLEDIRTFTEAHGQHDKWKTIRKWLRRNSAVYNLVKTVGGNIKAWELGYAILPDFQISDHEINSPKRLNGAEQVELNYAQDSREILKIDSPQYKLHLDKVRAGINSKLRGYETRIDHLTKEIVNFGATPIYVTNIRADYRFKGKFIAGKLRKYFELEPYHEVTRRHCREKNLLCVDVSRKVEVAPGDFFDVMHTTPSGSQKIGQEICNKLSSLNNIHLKKH